MGLPRIMMASLRGGSGKTVISMGILAAWMARGLKVVPFKKGPDYIDAGWLAMAAGHPCFNLDPFLMGKKTVHHSFQQRAQAGELSLIEGNRGLYDGINPQGTYSTSELAKMLKTPLVLIVDCTKTTRTVAAMILGCQQFDPALSLKGIVLNHIARSRHETIIRKSIEQYCGLPILGAIPRMPSSHFPERHLGLLPFQEHPEVGKAVHSAQNLAENYLDLDSLRTLAFDAPAMKSFTLHPVYSKKAGTSSSNPLIGVIQDEAFQFYYPENLEALEKAGAKLVFLNALGGAFPPGLDGLYIGGGFPETQALMLAQNASFRLALNEAIEEGLPVYAECGGLMYLGKTLIYQGEAYPMVGTLPLAFVLEKRPQGHGYTTLKVRKENPFFPVGMVLKGHEFHYSRVLDWDSCRIAPVFKMIKGFGLDGVGEGIVYKNVLATYTHLHALGTPGWAPALVEQSKEYKLRRTEGSPPLETPLEGSGLRPLSTRIQL
ncbi:MAG: cobyrinate a,c-diamide synthase [Deltaproteobacteria bacterium]|nr:cobyrinate a,c-diamide synthase [Deltaproteobacteria bacterium]